MESKNKQNSLDRFIPLRKNIQKKMLFFNQQSFLYKIQNLQQSQRNYISLLEFNEQQLYKDQQEIYKFNNFEQKRIIINQPWKVLDAPNLLNDFYTNLLDWSNKNLISIALDNQVFLYNAFNKKVSQININFTSQPTSLKFDYDGNSIIIGQKDGLLKIYDLEKNLQIYSNQISQNRLGCIEIMGDLIGVGSKDSKIRLLDNRQQKIAFILEKHKEEICGIKWNIQNKIIASGSNDNNIIIWDIRNLKDSKILKGHKSAVKSLTWNPYKQNELISGGGSKDKSIKFWNTHSNYLKHNINTESQVCNLLVSKNTNQLISSHGFPDNLINIWDLNQQQNEISLEGHKGRVLFLALSPDGKKLASAGGDQCLKIWDIFSEDKLQKNYLNVSLNQLR